MAGRIKTALARKLRERFGVDIEPDDLETTELACRLAGGASWGANATKDCKPVWVHSFSTMTECVANGDLSGELNDGMLEVV